MDYLALKRFEKLRKDLFRQIKAELEFDGYCKSVEGKFNVVLPDYHRINNENPIYRIELYCYVLGPSRHYQWEDETLMKAVAKAENDIRKWIAESEMEIKEELPAGFCPKCGREGIYEVDYREER